MKAPSPRRLAPLLLTLATALVTACASAPAQFYTLQPATDTATPASAPYRIDVLPVTVPEQVDRPQLVVRQSNDSVALLEDQRWIAPLEDELRGALATALSQRTHAADVHGLPGAQSTPVYVVRVQVRRFESVPDSHTLLAADWSLHPRGDQATAVNCSSTIKESVGQGYAALVRGHQLAVQKLAAAIAGTLQPLAAGQPPGCPGG